MKENINDANMSKYSWKTYEDGDFGMGPRGGVCEFYPVPFFGERSDRLNIRRLQGRGVKLSKKQKFNRIP